MWIFHKLHTMIFGQRIISVGHAATKTSESAVILFVGRRFVALSPEGARKVAEQLKVWADHAETMGRATHTMRWIVKVTKEPAEYEAVKWAEARLDAAASSLISEVLQPEGK